MTTPHADAPATQECPACHSAVPDASFCGRCGADLHASVDRWSVLLRPRVFATAHRERIWLPRVSSTLFPRIPGVTRKPYRIGLIFVLVAIVFFSLLQKNGPLGVIAVIGWPLLFLIYVWETDVFRDIPARILLVAMVLGIGLGVGWWLAAGKFIAGSYKITTASSLLLLGAELNTGFLVSLGGGVLMLVPALVTRLFKVPVRESLDGYVVGAFGALWFSTAAATTILGPQFAEGLIKAQGTSRMMEDAVTYGVVGPIITTTLGGLVGLLLWFNPNREPGRDPRRARHAMIICTILAAGLYAAVWRIGIIDLPRSVDMLIKIGLATLSLLTARAAVQIAMLHEVPDPFTGEPILCTHCEKVVPDMPFCVSCGCAARASSRTSRRVRRELPPVRELAAN